MIGNKAFMLTEDELRCYNEWSAKIARAHGNADNHDRSLEVKFTFSIYGTTIVAHLGGADRSGDLLIRDETDW